MPKRKHSDGYESDKIRRKIRRMEKRLKKHKRQLRRQSSVSSDSSICNNMPVPSVNEDVEELLPAYQLSDELYEMDTSTSVTAAGHQNDVICAASGSKAAATDHRPAPESADVVDPVAAAPVAADPVVRSSEQETSTSVEKTPNDDIILDDEILAFLGEAPSDKKKYDPKIQADIASRWEFVATSGVTKEVRKGFLEKYLTPENCTLIDPPILNLEVKAALSDALQKKDLAIQNKQKQIAAAISGIGQALKRALTQDQKDVDMIKILIDTGRIVCDVQHTESLMRRGFISSCIKKDIKDHLTETNIDKYLYGEKLADTLRAAKSIQKSGSEIRATTFKPDSSTKNKQTSRPLNWKRPAATSRPSQAGRRLETSQSAATWAPPPPAPGRPRPPPPPPPPPPPTRSQHQRSRGPRR